MTLERLDMPPVADAPGAPGAAAAPAAPGAGSGASTRLSRLPRPRRPDVPGPVWLITALHVALLLVYSFAYVTWAGYDEAQHVDMVYGLQNGDGWPGPGERIIARGVAATSDAFDRGAYAEFFQSGGKSRGEKPFVESAPTPRGERRSLDELGGDSPVTDGRLSNQMVQHPPLVYAVGAALLSAVPGSSHWSYDETVWLLRLLNILLMAPLPLLCFVAARRLRAPPAVSWTAAVVPLAVPGMTRVGATFNNDGLLILATGALTAVLAKVLTGDLRRRTAVSAGLLLAVALLAKAFALALPLVVVAAYLVGARRGAAPGTGLVRGIPALVRRSWLPLAVSLGLGALLGGSWWVRNYVLYGAVQPNGWGTDPPRREPLLLPDSFWSWFSFFWRTMVERFWGGLGMFEPPRLSIVATVAATVVLAVSVGALAVAALRRRGATGTGATGGAGGADGAGGGFPLTGRAAVLVLLAPAALAYAMVGQRSWAEYQRYTRGIAVQGRYLYLGIVGLAVVAAAGLARLLRGRARRAPLLALCGAILIQGAALSAVATYYWVPRGRSLGPTTLPDVAGGIGRWSPFPVGVTVLPFAAALVLLVAALVVVARATGRPTPPAAGSAGDGDLAVVAEHETVGARQSAGALDGDVPPDQ